MGSSKPPQPPSTGVCATDPVKKTTAECTSKCWVNDHYKRLSEDTYGRYFRKYHQNKKEYWSSQLQGKIQARLWVPLKSGTNIRVEVRFKPETKGNVSAAELTAAKNKLINGVDTYWNNWYTIEVDDPLCGKKSFKVLYKVIWVDSGEDYKLRVHEKELRENVDVAWWWSEMNVWKGTNEWTYAHEFGHCLGLPDEYSYTTETESVRYIKPDGSLDVSLSAPYNAKPAGAPDASMMSTANHASMPVRLCWNIAIEVQHLLREKLGRKVKCTVS